MKKILSLFLFLAIVMICGVTALASEVSYANGMDFYSNDTVEFYRNIDDEDKLYKIDLSNMSEEKVLDEHIISMVNKDENLYILAYNDEESYLLKFNMQDYSCCVEKTFDTFVSNMVIKDNNLYYVENKTVFSYDFQTKETNIILENTDHIYFTGENTLKYLVNSNDNYEIKTYNFNVSKNKKMSFFSSRSNSQISVVSAYIPRLEAPSTSSAYYIHTSHGGVNECIHISGGSVLPNCVGYAWGRSYENLGSRPNLSKGDAGTWYDYNRNGGYYSYGSTPALGSVVVWKQPGKAGHVAVVEVIDGDIAITSESAYGGTRWYTKTRSVSHYNFSASSSYVLQGFIYVCGSNSASDLGTDFYATINHATSGYAVGIKDTGYLELVDKKVTDKNRWHFMRQDDGSYIIYLNVGSQVMDVTNGDTTDGAKVGMSNVNYSSAQKWYICEEDGKYYFKTQSSNMVLDVGNKHGEIGDLVQMWTPNQTQAQYFTINKVVPFNDWIYIHNASETPILYSDEDVIFTYDAVTSYFYDLWIYKNGERQGQIYAGPLRKYQKRFAAGEYELLFASQNDVGWNYGRFHPFKVVDRTKTIYFDANGGTTEQSAKILQYNAPYGTLLPAKRDGYIFKGWYTAKNGGTQVISTSLADSVSNVTLYAQWEEITTKHTVSGNVTRFNNADVTVELLSDGEVVNSVTASSTYSFEDVAEGEYTLRVSAPKHATREYLVTVGSEDVTQNVEIWLYGDVTKDGVVNNSDVMQINRKNNNMSSVFNQTADAEYRMKVANVTAITGTDTVVNNADVMQINRNINNMSSVFDRIA